MRRATRRYDFPVASIALLLACEAAPRVAAADSLLGLYVGGAIGRSTIRNDEILLTSPASYRYDFDQHHTGWKVVVGVRPIPSLGAELAYLDFGHARVNTYAQYLPLVADAQARGEAAFAVGHLPIPVPMLDVYGKLGVAHLRTSVNATNLGHPQCTQVCSDIVWIPGTYRHDSTNTDLAYGAGIQLKLASAGIRLEYERVNLSGGNADLASVGVTWTF